MIKCTNLRKSFKDNCVVNDICFEVKENEVFALLGSNGAGKTTTIKMILGLLKMDNGEIEIDKQIKIGYSPETPYFPPFLTGYEVMKYYSDVSKSNNSKEELIQILDLVGLEVNKVKVKNYSKGMLQRLALGQALLDDPDLLILDEPCAGLDAMGRIEMMELIGELKQSGKTIIINSHILADIERVCDRGIIMKQGVIKQQWNGIDPLEEVFVKAIGGMSI